jgi:hypothetical protein
MLKKMSVVLGLAATVIAVACGGGGGQPESCKNYVACAKKIGANASPDTIEAAYGSSGTCFVGGATTACGDACTSGLNGLKTAYADAGC